MEEEEAPLPSMWEVCLCRLFGEGQRLFIAFDMDTDYLAYALQTFFISDPNAKEESKSARACDACYETVFPLIPDGDTDSTANAHNPDYRTINSDALGTLSGFPSWLSMPVLPVASNPAPAPKALMAIDLDGDWQRRSLASKIIEHPKGRARVRSRPRSFHQALEDFSYEDQDKENRLGRGRGRGRSRERFDVVNVSLEEDEGERGEGGDEEGEEEKEVGKVGVDRTALSSSPRKENTARRVKRFSLPAVALHTTSVTARTAFVDVDPSDVGETKVNKRFSLVLGAGGHGKGYSGRRNMHDGDGEHEGDGGERIDRETGSSVAVGKLSELLGRRK